MPFLQSELAQLKAKISGKCQCWMCQGKWGRCPCPGCKLDRDRHNAIARRHLFWRIWKLAALLAIAAGAIGVAIWHG